MNNSNFEQKFIAARRAAISCDFTHLNDIQREAALTTQGPLLLLAGAGSGKTTVLINRIANLLKYGSGSDSEYVHEGSTAEELAFLETYASPPPHDEEAQAPKDSPQEETQAMVQELCAVDPVEPWRIIAITFTNKAAGEIKERLERMLGPESQDIWAMTFHSACSRILRRDIERLGYGSSFTIYDTSDTASLMKRILKELDVEERNLPHKTVLGYISRAKDTMTFAGEFLSEAESSGDMRRKIIGRAYLEYENRMKASNALDFDDLILLTVRLFMENPDVLQHYQKRFKYVLIDEYQDTNNLQYLLASYLAGGHGNICVVGDDDQSIYKFRGATIENIMSFERNFKDARVIRLEQNYRSTGFILSAANDVIRNNKGRKGKKLWTVNESGIKPELHITGDEREEALFVAGKITSSVMDGHKWSDHAVLYRMNAQSNQLETAFKRGGVPYRIIGGTGFYERAEIKDMLSYLCVINNPNDDVRLLRIINNPPRKIGATTIDRLRELAAEIGCPVYEAIRETQKHETLKSSAAKLHQFADMLDSLRESANSVPLDELYDMLLKETGYIKMLEEKDTNENLSRIENVRELKTNIIGFMNDNENGGSLFEFLSETALYTDFDRDDNSADRVSMMTMHSAKGLEFDTVFVVGAEEGVFPGSRTIGDPAEIEEERRLCYVAMTRAMQRLYFTSARQRMIFGKTASAQTSRFVREISGENIDIHEPSSRFGSFGLEPSAGYGHASAGLTERSRQSRSAQVPPSPPPSSHSGLQNPKSESREALPDYKKGDMITHTAFGSGVITSIKLGGGDALLEIAFDGIGTKRLLLKSAARYMSK